MNSENVLEWDEKTITENLNIVLRKIRESVVCNDEKIVFDYIVFSFEKVFHHVPAVDVEELILKSVCLATSEIFQNTIAGIENQNDLSVFSQTQMNRSETCGHLLDLCCLILVMLLQSLQHFLSLDEITYNNLKYYTRTLVNVVKMGREHYFNRNQFYKDQDSGVEDFGRKLTELQAQYYVLISTKMKFDFDRAEEITAFEGIFTAMSEAAVAALNGDVVFMASTWKSLLTFAEKFQEHVIETDEISTVLCKLSEKIEHDFDAIFDSVIETANTLKIDNFLLKILIKLCQFFGNIGSALNPLLRFALILFRSTPTFLRSAGKSEKEITDITKHLSGGADPLLFALYTGPEFPATAKRLLEENCKKNPYGCLMLLLSLWKKLTTVPLRAAFFCDDFNSLEFIFNITEMCHSEMVSGKFFAAGSVVQADNPDLYEFILTRLAGVLLTVSDEEFERVEDTLLLNILQPYPWRATLACDLWVLIARCRDSALCNATVSALLPVLDTLDFNTSRPEFIYLSSLVRRLCRFTDHSCMLTISEKYPPNRNTKIWAIIGLQSFKPETRIPDVVNSCVSVISNWSKSDAPSVHLHSRMQDSLLAISSIPSEFDELRMLWNCFPEVDHRLLLDSYLHAVAFSTAASIAVLPENAFIEILHNICKITSKNLSASQQLSILLVLSNLFEITTSERNTGRFLNYVTTAFKSLLNSESHMIRNIALKYFTQLSYSPAYTQYITKTVSEDRKLKQDFSDFLMKVLPRPVLKPIEEKTTFVHRCYNERDNTRIVNFEHKKVKLDDNVNFNISKVQEALTRMEEDVEVLFQNYDVLSNEQKDRIKSLHCTLAQVYK